MKTDYSIALDDEIHAFIARTNSFYPPETATYPIDKQRAIYDHLCTSFRVDLPPDVRFEDRKIENVPCRVYTPKTVTHQDVVLMYLHGGGFVVGGLESHHDICAEISSRARLPLVSVDYALAPENQFPQDYIDAEAVFQSLGKHNHLILIGDSAGGTLASSIAHVHRHNPAILAQVLIYPGLSLSDELPSMIRHENAPMLSAADVRFYGKIRGEYEAGDIRASALLDADFSAICPTFIYSAECDPLADGGIIYAQNINAAGGFAVNSLDIGLVHGHLRARHMSARAKAVFDNIIARVNEAAAR